MIVDPTQRNDKGTTAIDWFVASHDGKRVAVSLSDNGSEKGTLHVFDTATGEELPDVIPRVQNPTGGGSVAWNGDHSGFWYTRYPAPLERPVEDEGFYQQVWFHELGTPIATDTKSFGDDLPRIAETALEFERRGERATCSRRSTTVTAARSRSGCTVRTAGGAGSRASTTAIGTRCSAATGRSTRSRSPGRPRGRIVAMDRDAPTLLKAVTIVPQSDVVIEELLPTATRLYVTALLGGPSEIRVYSLAGKPLAGSGGRAGVHGIDRCAARGRRGCCTGDESFVTPFAWYIVDPKRGGGRPVKTALSAPPDDVDPAGIAALTVTRVMATSKDGTQVPVKHRREEGHRAGRHASDVADGVMGGFGIFDAAVLLARDAVLAAPRRRLRARQPARRRRVRRSVASRRQPDEEAERFSTTSRRPRIC